MFKMFIVCITWVILALIVFKSSLNALDNNLCVSVLGSGSLRAKFELSDGPSIPATLAVQFFNESSTLSGVEMELVGSGYRLSLSKKRLVSGKAIHF